MFIFHREFFYNEGVIQDFVLSKIVRYLYSISYYRLF